MVELVIGASSSATDAEQAAQNVQIAANTAALMDAANARQAELDAAVATIAALEADNATQAELDTAIADRVAAQAALDAAQDLVSATKTELTAEEAARIAADTALQTELDAQELKQNTHEIDTDVHLPTVAANQIAQRNAANDAWVGADYEPLKYVPFLSAQGWLVEGFELTSSGGKKISIGSGTATRVTVTGDVEVQPVAEQIDASFRYVSGIGRVDTGLDGSDVSAPVNEIEQAVGYDPDGDGVLADITAVGTDASDAGPYKVFLNPITGEVDIALPQKIATNTSTGLDRHETYPYVKAPYLSGWIFVGTLILDEDAPSITYIISSNSAGGGSNPSGPTAVSAGTLYKTTFAEVDPIPASELVAGMVVYSGSGATYREDRVIVVSGADFSTSTTEQIWPHAAGVEADFQAGAADYAVAKIQSPETLNKIYGGPWRAGIDADNVLIGERVYFSSGVNSANISNPTEAGQTTWISNASPVAAGSSIPLTVQMYSHQQSIVRTNWNLFPGETLQLIAAENAGSFYWIPSVYEKSPIVPAFTPTARTINNYDYELTALRGATVTANAIKMPTFAWGQNHYIFGSETTGTVRFIASGEGDVANPSGTTFRIDGVEVSHVDYEFKGNAGHLLFRTDENGKWYYIEEPGSGSEDMPMVPIAADNKPVAYQAVIVDADTTLDLADVPATAEISYYVKLAPNVILTGANSGAVSHNGPHYEMVHLVSTGTAGEVERVGNDAATSDPIANWEPNTAYLTGDRTIMYAPIGAPAPYTEGNPYLVEAPADRPAVANLDLAQWNLWTVVGEHIVSGGSKRILDTTSAFPYAVSAFKLSDLQTNDWIITQDGIGSVCTWYSTPIGNFKLIDYTNGAVSHSLAGPNRSLSFTKPCRFVQTTQGNLETVVVYLLEQPIVALQAREFAGYMPYNGGNHYFMPSVTGTYDIKMTLVVDTNNAIFSEIRSINPSALTRSFTGDRVTNTKRVSTSTATFNAGIVYSIDPVGAGGTSSGYISVEITLRP